MKIQDVILINEMEITSLKKQLRNPLMWFFRKQIQSEIKDKQKIIFIYKKMLCNYIDELPKN
jgi:hypothetical protein